MPASTVMPNEKAEGRSRIFGEIKANVFKRADHFLLAISLDAEAPPDYAE